MLEFGQRFYQQGGRVLALDEVHKYPQWAKEVKNLYDRYSDLKIIFTGSSILEINKQVGELSRRALLYELKGMSYREYLEFAYELSLPLLSLDQILSSKFNLLEFFPSSFRPLQYFSEYLKYGYYPFTGEGKAEYFKRIRQLTRSIVEYDMAEIKGFDIRQAKKLLQLLYIIAQQVPFKPNLSSPATKTNIHRNSINNYLYYFEESRLIQLLQFENYSVSTLQKPEKLYLDNTNLLFALSESTPETGNIRETFFYNQLAHEYKVNQSKHSDFIINQKYTFEIGGPGKRDHQIKGIKNSWMVKDAIEYNSGNQLPLWIFGFLY